MDYFVYYHAEATKSWVIRLKAIAAKIAPQSCKVPDD